MSEYGSITWPSQAEPIWRFNYHLADSPDEEGIVISQVYFRNRKVFWKASLPSLRVQYDGSCGPYKDPLNYNNAKTTALCTTKRVCIKSFVSSGYRGLQIQSYHTIGAYKLTHRWILWENGWIYPRLYSAGLQCNYNHRHHAYWRFDFDIGGAASDLVLEYNTYTPNQGWGNGWHTKTMEISRLKNSNSKRSWAILDKQSGRGYHILPGSHDGGADAFSNRDVWIMRYSPSEDKHGQQGNAYSDGLQTYINGENIDGRDVVFWYSGHLFHEAAHGADEWHHAGPTLVPFQNWDWA